ncbi:acetyltransferase [Chryseobacterium daecheongense]|uniref:Acetyltransferase n=1 Tax=Chryseobacterium daecheongense TaxID=192389 RepID=A0A3N0W644_9FLAO|nr:acetyltransferase [Chryseobacterium daecheongense]ROI00530.1 acetyltransferase [Chryseobacterium daecheongense]TDX94492.1 sugar O-acyltransferase (sialic acid O-acetyltransferase NeuD family) [Chryseobacterium daecheongense]
MKKIAIVGAGGFGREVKMLIEDINEKNAQFEIIGFYDDKEYKTEINGLPYLGEIKNINEVDYPLCLAVAIAAPNIKKKIVEGITNENIEYPNLIHPSVIIGRDDVKLGKGNIICAGVIITVNIKIEDFIILNLSCTVGHDTQIKKYSSFMPSVNISGEVIINEEVYVGTGAKIINLLEVGQKTIIGAGAVVSKDLPANCTAVGIPAKPIKFHE